MLELRPIVVDSNMVVLGGNMRLKACLAAGLKEVPIIVADKLTDAQKAEFVIKDNVGFGEWDWEMLANQWDADLLTDWGLDIPHFDGELPEDNGEDIDPNALLVEGTPEQLEDLLTELNTRGFKVKFK